MAQPFFGFTALGPHHRRPLDNPEFAWAFERLFHGIELARRCSDHRAMIAADLPRRIARDAVDNLHEMFMRRRAAEAEHARAIAKHWRAYAARHPLTGAQPQQLASRANAGRQSPEPHQGVTAGPTVATTAATT